MSALSVLNEQISRCQSCEIGKHRNRVVPGEGADNAAIMFIGEAPGLHEDQQGRPFVGSAGQFLDQLLASIDLDRSKVFIANVIKCRPPGNRDPLPAEIGNCAGWLEQQINIIRPKMIVTLGRFSMARYFPGRTISKIHGTALKKDGIIYYAMYHPAAALHQYRLRQTIQDDMLRIPRLLAEAEQIIEDAPPPQQLSMFDE